MEIKCLNNIQKEIYSKISNYNIFPINEAHLQIKKNDGENILIYEYKTDNEFEFNVFIEFNVNTYSIYCENWHEIEVSINTSEDIDALLHKLVSFFNGSTKLIVKYSNEKLFCWELFHNNDEMWVSLGKTKLVLFNYFGKIKKLNKINSLINN